MPPVGNQITLRPKAGFIGTTTISVFAQGPCGLIPTGGSDATKVSISQFVGTAKAPTSMSIQSPFPQPICPNGGRWFKFVSPAGEGATQYRWEIRLDGVVIANQVQSGPAYLIEPTEAGWYSARCYSINACGQSLSYATNSYEVVEWHPNCGGRARALRVSPNPATNGTLSVELVNEGEKASTPMLGRNSTETSSLSASKRSRESLGELRPRAYRLLDQMGLLVRSGTFTGDRVSVSTQGLRVGVYTLVVMDGDQPIQTKVIVQ